MSWEEAVRKLFQKHPRAMSANTVIEAIKENHCDAQLRAEGRIAEREEIAKAIKALPQHALFYPENILKILKLH